MPKNNSKTFDQCATFTLTRDMKWVNFSVNHNFTRISSDMSDTNFWHTPVDCYTLT